MAKRKSSIVLSEFIPAEEITDTGPTTRVRTFTPEVHVKLMRVARGYYESHGIELEPVPGVFGTDNRSEFKAHLKEFGRYFTNDEYTHLAEYLRGAADALELVD